MPDIPHPNRVRWGKIVANGIPDYQITSNDVCTLAVSTQGEDAHAPQYIIWCYINRKCTNGWKNVPLHRIVQRHSQPINPIWAWPRDAQRVRLEVGTLRDFNGPSEFRRYVDRYGETGRLSPDVQRRRRNNIAKLNALRRGSEEEWARVPINIKTALYMILRGEVGNMCPGKTDFANLPGTHARRDAVRLGGWTDRNGNRQVNSFISQPPLPSGRIVQVIAPDGSSSINKRQRSFPPDGNYNNLGDFSTEPTMMAAQTQAGENETNNPDTSTSTGQGGSNEITVSTQGVPDSEQTVQRYVRLDRRQLMSHIDSWAQEIEDLLTTFDT